jgi:hypothetical protein
MKLEGGEGKYIGDEDWNRYVWKKKDWERHFDLSQMAARELAGADCKGRGQDETELDCRTLGLDGKHLRGMIGGARFLVGVRLLLIGKNILGDVAEVVGKAGVAFRCEEDMDVLNRRNVIQVTSRATLRPEGADPNFIPFIGTLEKKARRIIGMAWGLMRRGFVGSGYEASPRRSASGGLPLLLRFSGDRSFHGVARSGKVWRRGNHFGHRRLGFREQGGGRVDQRADHFRVRHGRGVQGLMVIEHPSGEHRFGRLLDPLVDQGGNFLAQICGMVEPCQLKTLQRGARSRLKIVERRSESRYGHGQGSDLRAGPKGPDRRIIGELY